MFGRTKGKGCSLIFTQVSTHCAFLAGNWVFLCRRNSVTVFEKTEEDLVHKLWVLFFCLIHIHRKFTEHSELQFAIVS